MASAPCSFVKANGEPCKASPLKNSQFCRIHDPASAREVAEARRLGGLRRRREKTTAAIYDWGGLDSVGNIRHLLSIAVTDTLGLENSVARSRTLAHLCQVSLKALEVGELEDRVDMLEQTLKAREPRPRSKR